MTHKEFIEKKTRWLPAYEAKKAGKKAADIAKDMGVSNPVAGNMLKFVERNFAIPCCEYLGDLPQDTVAGVLCSVRVHPLSALREDLIAQYQVKPEGPIQMRRHLIGSVVLRRLLERSGLKWYDLDGAPVVHWEEKA